MLIAKKHGIEYEGKQNVMKSEMNKFNYITKFHVHLVIKVTNKKYIYLNKN